MIDILELAKKCGASVATVSKYDSTVATDKSVEVFCEHCKGFIGHHFYSDSAVEFYKNELSIHSLLDEVLGYRRGVAITHVGGDPVDYFQDRWCGLIPKEDIARNIARIEQALLSPKVQSAYDSNRTTFTDEQLQAFADAISAEKDAEIAKLNDELAAQRLAAFQSMKLVHPEIESLRTKLAEQQIKLEHFNIRLQQAKEMAEALTTDDESSLLSVGNYSDAICVVLFKALEESTMKHTDEENFQHFLSYSKLSTEPLEIIEKMRIAYYAGSVPLAASTVLKLGLVPYKDGDQWCVLYGSNLQEGISGFGDTPDAAMENFDLNWNKHLTEEELQSSHADLQLQLEEALARIKELQGHKGDTACQ